MPYAILSKKEGMKFRYPQSEFERYIENKLNLAGYPFSTAKFDFSSSSGTDICRNTFKKNKLGHCIYFFSRIVGNGNIFDFDGSLKADTFTNYLSILSAPLQTKNEIAYNLGVKWDADLEAELKGRNTASICITYNPKKSRLFPHIVKVGNENELVLEKADYHELDDICKGEETYVSNVCGMIDDYVNAFVNTSYSVRLAKE